MNRDALYLIIGEMLGGGSGLLVAYRPVYEYLATTYGFLKH
jgi:hypothetical protein